MKLHCECDIDGDGERCMRQPPLLFPFDDKLFCQDCLLEYCRQIVITAHDGVQDIDSASNGSTVVVTFVKRGDPPNKWNTKVFSIGVIDPSTGRVVPSLWVRYFQASDGFWRYAMVRHGETPAGVKTILQAFSAKVVGISAIKTMARFL